MKKPFYCSRCEITVATETCPQCGRKTRLPSYCTSCKAWHQSARQGACPGCRSKTYCGACKKWYDPKVLECPDCERPIGKDVLARRFLVPPFSALFSDDRNWREGRQKWAKQGVVGNAVNDPFLGELMYRWFAPKWGGRVLDPFAGDAINGIVAAYLGYPYTGIVVQPEQVKANEAKFEGLCPNMDQRKPRPTWVYGGLPRDERYDLIFTTLPQHNFKRSSYGDFWAQAITALKDHRFCLVKFREESAGEGFFTSVYADTTTMFKEQLDLGLYNEAVRFLPGAEEADVQYEHVLGFFKGNPAQIPQELGYLHSVT